MTVEIRVLSSIRDVPQEAWDALHTDADSPFVEWEWLDALETTKCVSRAAGWLPQHITCWRDGQLFAASPAYIKTNSEGEFVYDWSWADLANRVGVDYYPKLILAVPFTPATGSRLLRAPGENLQEVAQWIARAAIAIAEKFGLSGVHVLFPHRDECDALQREGLVQRLGVQFHWHNEGYEKFDDFLARFQSKKRNAIKRERAQLGIDHVQVQTHRGATVTPDLIDPMFQFYKSTVDKFFYGRQYLNRAFFSRIVERFSHRLEWVVARDPNGTPIAGAFNARRGTALYGRYWGAIEDRPFLHFNVCFYHSIEDGIRTGVQLFEPGAGGEHKLVRGFEPSLTYSAHWIRDPKLDHILRQHLVREAAAVQQSVENELEQSPLRRKT